MNGHETQKAIDDAWAKLERIGHTDPTVKQCLRMRGMESDVLVALAMAVAMYEQKEYFANKAIAEMAEAAVVAPSARTAEVDAWAKKNGMKPCTKCGILTKADGACSKCKIHDDLVSTMAAWEKRNQGRQGLMPLTKDEHEALRRAYPGKTYQGELWDDGRRTARVYGVGVIDLRVLVVTDYTSEMVALPKEPEPIKADDFAEPKAETWRDRPRML